MLFALSMVMDGMKRLRGIIIPIEEKEYGSFVKTHFSSR